VTCRVIIALSSVQVRDRGYGKNDSSRHDEASRFMVRRTREKLAELWRYLRLGSLILVTWFTVHLASAA
jgi:hypothetical protein